MSFRKQSGNMYDFVTHTWNVIKGKCSHDCSYCYMKRFPLGKLRFDEKEMGRDLGSGNFIFVGSSTDMWARDIPLDWINRVLYHCRSYSSNKYLFQSKNPDKFIEFKDDFPERTILGTTIETNRFYDISFAPKISDRQYAIKRVAFLMQNKPEIMITIEPILDFDLDEFVWMIKTIQPNFVNIGADSKGHGLPEPTYSKVLELIEALSEFTEIRKKTNLKRLEIKQ